MHDRVVSQDERSMRDNLLFMGIPETDNENCEVVIQNFIDKNLPSTKENGKFSFERVHRIEKPQSTNPRPIVARFSRFKEREIVRTSARELKNTNFSIREQYPMEILERRRILQDKLTEARDRQLRATLYRDTLRVEDKEFKVDKEGKVYKTDTVLPVTTRFPHQGSGSRGRGNGRGGRR